MTATALPGSSADTATARTQRSTPVSDILSSPRLHWCLRIGAAACFIGHGAFGIITKAGWLPYFAVVGIPADVAYRIMPLVGTVDIVAGISMLVAPQPIVLLYMAVWALWTALLRPLSGESVFEAVERAGNYGVPLAMLMVLGRPTGIRSWLQRRTSSARRGRRETVTAVLHVTTVMLLIGHGGLMAIVGKSVFTTQYATIGLSAAVVPIVGWVEIVVALVVAVRPHPRLLFGIAVWKMATEVLYPLSGTPIWEFIERAGSYTAPLALAMLSTAGSLPRFTVKRSAE